MNMKRIISLLLAFVLLAGLTSAFAETDKTIGIANILIIETDTRKAMTNSSGRLDSMTILSLNGDTGAVKIVSLDCSVRAPFPADMLPGGGPSEGMLADAFYLGGGELAKRVVSDAFGVDISRFAQADVEAFEELIDNIGGIEVELTELEAKALEKESGTAHLTGPEAISFVNLEHNDNAKTRRQAVISGVLDALRSYPLTDLGNLLNSIRNLADTDLSVMNFISILMRADRFLSSTVSEIRVPDKDHAPCDFAFEGRKINSFIY